MKQRSNTQTEATNMREQPARKMAEEGIRSYQQTLRAGQTLQEQAARWWLGMFNQTAAAQDWQKTFAHFFNLTDGLVPATQKRMEEARQLLEKNSRTGAELFRKAMEAAQTPIPAESQAKWFEFWTSSLGALRYNLEAMTQMQSRMLDAWIDFMKKNVKAGEAELQNAA